MEGLAKMSKQKLYSIVELEKELNLANSSVRRILGKEGAPQPKVKSEFVEGKKTCNLYDLEEVITFYHLTKGIASEKKKTNPFNKLFNAFLQNKL